MGVDHKKGDVVKIRISGEIVNCIVISDLMTEFEIGYNDYFLGIIDIEDFELSGYKICLWKSEKCMFASIHFIVLIGDHKVYVEHDEIW